MTAIWSLIPIPVRLGLAAALFLAVSGGIWYVHYSIDKGGYDRCAAELKAAADAQAADARKTIIKTGKKYDKIRSDLRKKAGGNLPVSPHVGDAIDRMPNP